MNFLESIAGSIGITRVNDISRFDLLPIYVYQTCRPTSIHLCIDSGKSKHKETAKLVALMEAIERYAAENIANDSFNVKPDVLDLIFLDFNFRMSLGKFTVRCYNGFNVISGKSEYIPSDLIEYSLSNPYRLINVFPSGTTGLGAHFKLELAICSGLVEVIERDAIANNDYIIIDPNSLEGELKEKLQLVSSKVGKYSIRAYKSIWPVFVFAVISEDSSVNGGMIGFGLGFTAKDGLNDALDEAFQTWLMRISAARDDWAFSTLPFGNEKPNIPIVSFPQLDNFGSIPSGSNVTITKLHEQNYNKLLSFAAENKIDIFAVLIATPTPISPIKVVKVVVPSSKLLRQGSMLTGIPIVPIA